MHLTSMVHRWQSYLVSGEFSLSVSGATHLGEPNPLYDFWTSPYPYWDMEAKAPSLFESLKKSELVIFKVFHLHYSLLNFILRTPVSPAEG